jgi:PhnB protein
MSISYRLNRRSYEADNFNASLTFQPVNTRSAIMSKAKVKPIPDGTHSLTAHIVCANAYDAMDFYKKAFGAVEEMRMAGPDGKLMHGCVRIGDSQLMLTEENPSWGALGPKALKGSPITIHLTVANVDATVAQAVAAGAKIAMPVEDAFWGDRYGQLQDPFGHRWSVATHIRDMSTEEIQAAMGEAMAKMGEPCTANVEK